MTILANITAFSVGTANEELRVSNAGFTKNANFWGGLNGDIKVTNLGGVNTAYSDAAGQINTAGYVWDTPATTNNVTVKATLRRRGSPTSGLVYVIARCGASANDWIGAAYDHAQSYVGVGKYVDGSAFTLSNTSVTALADGGEGVLELRVSGAPGAITAQAYWNGTPLASLNITESQFTGLNSVALFTRGDYSETDGIHYKTFYAEDDGGGDTTPRPLADISVTGWTSTGASIAAVIDEAVIDDADYATSPVITGAGSQAIVSLTNGPLAAGYWAPRVRASVTSGTATMRISLLNDSNASQGSADVTVTSTITTFNPTILTTGSATRLAIEFFS